MHSGGGMETDTQPLEIVCRHFRDACGDATIVNLRRRLSRAHVQNHRLRKKALQLSEQLTIERSCRAVVSEILTVLIRRMDSVLTVRDRTADA